MNWKIDEDLRKNPLHKAQHGFTKRKGTESAASNVVSYIENNIYSTKHCIGVFLDISSAFDTIRPSHIKEEMKKRTENEDLVEWYYNYLMHRNMNFELQGATKRVSNSLGFPQGGVASAKMWLVAFDKAIEIIFHMAYME